MKPPKRPTRKRPVKITLAEWFGTGILPTVVSSPKLCDRLVEQHHRDPPRKQAVD